MLITSKCCCKVEFEVILIKEPSPKDSYCDSTLLLFEIKTYGLLLRLPILKLFPCLPSKIVSPVVSFKKLP